MAKPRLLIVDDEPGLRELLDILFRRAGYDVTLGSGAKAGLALIQSEPSFDAIVTDLVMPDGSGMTILKAAIERDDTTQVLMITAHATTEQAVAAMRLGAYDYIEKPFKNDALLAAIEKALEKRALLFENRALRAEVRGDDLGLVGTSEAMRELRTMIRRVGPGPSSVLITGESGTGKEIVARAIHRMSPRKDAPFVSVNCGALPSALMESELFGHERGAFTGAHQEKRGLFRAAEGGTVFLDEIGELPREVQVKLLRTLQERAVRPVGSAREVPVDVRVIAATNRDLEEEVREGRFREDLFYRLNVIRLHLAPLRERPEDIAPLIEHFLQRQREVHGIELRLDEGARAALLSRSYPGNVRELENLIERGAALSVDGRITREALGLGEELVPSSTSAHPTAPRIETLPEGFELERYLASEEERFIRMALKEADGVRTRAAELLGMSFRQFRYRLSKYERESSK